MSMIKQLAPKIEGYRKETILTPVYMLGEVALECVIPYVMAGLMLESGRNNQFQSERNDQ